MKIIQILPPPMQVIHKNNMKNRLLHSDFRSTYVRRPCIYNSCPNASLNDSMMCHTDVLPSTIDFIPNYQDLSVLDKEENGPIRSRKGNFDVVSVLEKVFIILIVSYLFASVAQFAHKEKQEMLNNSVAVPSNQKLIHCSINRLLVVSTNKKIKYLNKRLNNLSKALKETLKWRATVDMDLKEIKESNLKHNELITRKIEQRLNLYDADKIGIIDYALESAGGSVVSTPKTIPLPAQFSYLIGFVTVNNPSSPRHLIQPGTLPGNCFAFVGSTGRIRIQLAHLVQITAVTMEHAYPSLVGDMSSAPKDFKVYGFSKHDAETGDELGAFTYKLNETALQSFAVNYWMSYQHVELHILTNHGNLDYTCIYRFRVHGNSV